MNKNGFMVSREIRIAQTERMTSVSFRLFNAWDPVMREFAGVHVPTLAGKRASWFLRDSPYFFLRKELGITNSEWKAAKERGDIRHCVPWESPDPEVGWVFLDYVVKKTFATLEEWAADAGGTIGDVLYGENRVHKTTMVWDFETNKFIHIPDEPKYVPLVYVMMALRK